MTTQEVQDLFSKLMGRDKITAANLCRQFKMKPRMCREDKAVYIITHDLDLERVNLEYDNGLVTNVYLG